MLYQFEDFALDTGRRELRRNDAPVAVEPKVFDLIVHLVTHRDRVVDKDDLIASVWGGRIVSDTALASAVKAARGVLGDDGDSQRLIKTLPRKGVRFVGAVADTPVASPPAGAPSSGGHALPDRPSVAVLPFENMSADSEQEYFSDGVVEEIITALSQNRMLFVIARNSSFAYKGRSVDVVEVGHALGVRYVLTGSVRRSAGRLRIAAQLIDAATRANIWAGHVEGALDDIFALQDRVTQSVVSAMVPKLEDAEIARAKRKTTTSLNAYDHFLRGLWGVNQRTREASREAIGSALRATEIDPDFASAYGLAAFCYTQRRANAWTDDNAKDIAAATRLARRAADLGKGDALALGWAGQVLAYVAHELDTGSALVEHALQMNPNLTFAWHWSGWIQYWLGDAEAGLERVTHAMRLSPLDPFLPVMQGAMAHGHFFAGRHAEAAAWARKAVAEGPELSATHRICSASSVFAGDMDRARESIEKLRRVDPELRVATLRDRLGPYRRADFIAKYEEGLRRAGLPE